MNLDRVIKLFTEKIGYNEFQIFNEPGAKVLLTDLEIDNFKDDFAVQIIITESTAAIQFAFYDILNDEETLKILNIFNNESSNIFRATIDSPEGNDEYVLFLTSFFITNFLRNEEDYAEKLKIYFEDFGISLIVNELEDLLKVIR